MGGGRDGHCQDVNMCKSIASDLDRNVQPLNFQIPWTVICLYYPQPISFFFLTQFGVFSFFNWIYVFEVSKKFLVYWVTVPSVYIQATKYVFVKFCLAVRSCWKNLLETQLARFATKLYTINLISSWTVWVQHFHCLEHQLELYRQIFAGESILNSTTVDTDREHIVDKSVNNNLVFYIVSAVV